MEIEKDKIEKDKFVEIDRKDGVSTLVYISSNYPGPIAIDATIHQPERSKREDGESRCGALNSMET